MYLSFAPVASRFSAPTVVFNVVPRHRHSLAVENVIRIRYTLNVAKEVAKAAVSVETLDP